MNWFKKLFSRKPKKTEPTKKEESTYIDVLISLNKNLEIDLSIFLANDDSKTDMDRINYILACAEFLNTISSDQLKPDIISILDTQIRYQTSDQLIDSILLFLEKTNKKSGSPNKTFIKPSQVFSKYSV